MRLPLKLETELRALSRNFGLTGIYHRARRALGRDRAYEEAFNAALRSSVQAGDVVWDIGANVGRYTMQFSDWVGSSGHVVAFEPVAATFKRLTEATRGRDNVVTVAIALGQMTTTAQIHVAADPAAGTHSLTKVKAGLSTQEVQIEPGDAVVGRDGIPSPNVLKIDVEGSEFDVLSGLDRTLRVPSCRAVACEVHFGVLAARGEKQKPREIEQLLRHRGFLTRWTDASHLLATRE